MCVLCFVSVVSFFKLTAFSSIFYRAVFVDRYCLNLITWSFSLATCNILSLSFVFRSCHRNSDPIIAEFIIANA